MIEVTVGDLRYPEPFLADLARAVPLADPGRCPAFAARCRAGARPRAA
jgi:hypothetical protein